MGESVIERERKLIKNGFSDKTLTEKEKDALLHFQKAWDNVLEGIKPFTVLFSQQQKGEEEIRKAVTEILFGMYFFSARTCDGVSSVEAQMQESLKTTTAQLELAKQEGKNAKLQAKIALFVAILSIIVGAGISAYYGHCARKDSEATTVAIVSAIRETVSQTK